jgi:phosphopantothenoylcysteine decarboxylase/phosphopantothenate--cysteine ligase
VDTLAGQRVLLGVTGGIAAYKAPALVRALRAEGAAVRVVMTRAAAEFVTPMSLQVVSGAAVGTDLFDPAYEAEIGHIELARWASVVLVAPATANVIAQLAHGMASDLLTTVLLATTAPVVFAPAMNTQMLRHPAVAANLTRLRDELGVTVVEPDAGDLACGEQGPGRMPDPPELIDGLLDALRPKRLRGQRVLLTVGPTRERIDAARFLTNPSSGRMGFAMARAARHLGAEVVVVAGPVSVPAPVGVRCVRVESALQMAAAVDAELAAGCDIAVFTAAVADFRPTEVSEGKRGKGTISESLALTRNPDILAGVCARSPRPYCVGFAAETGDLETKAVAKCARKGCDLIVGNDVSGGAAFGTDDNRVVLADAERVLVALGPASKVALAAQIWDAVLDVRARS